MSTLFDVDLKNNKLYDPSLGGFDQLAVSGGTIATSASTANDGYGWAVTPDSGYTNYCAVGIMKAHNLTTFRQRFYVNPSEVNISDGGYLTIARNFIRDTYGYVYRLLMSYTIAGGYKIQQAIYYDDTNAAWGAAQTLNYQTGWNRIEHLWTSASSGYTGQMWLDGTLVSSVTSDSSTLRVLCPCLGSHVTSGSITGNIYFSNWKANDDGSEIGP